MREKKEINVFVGNQIQTARVRAGLTQEEFGALVSLGPKNVSDIERGVVGISISTLKRICEKLSVSGDWILFGDQSRNRTDYLMQKLGCLPENQFQAVEAFLNQTFYMFGILEKGKAPNTTEIVEEQGNGQKD